MRPTRLAFSLLALSVAVLVGTGSVAVAADQAKAKPTAAAATTTVASPSGVVAVTIEAKDLVTWSVSVRGKTVVVPSPLSITLANRTLGQKIAAPPKIIKRAPVDQILKPTVRAKRAEVRDRFNEQRLDFGDYALVVRAYDDGAAYRWETKIPGDIEVRAEQATFHFAGDYPLLFPQEDSLMSHQERLYKRITISEVAKKFASLPAMVMVPDGPKLAITEADLFDYPGMDLTSTGEANTLAGLFPYYPAKTQLARDRDENVTEREAFMAKTAGTRTFPWRVLVVAERDETFIDTDIVFRLASECRLTDTSWIKPGKVAWDWWNFNNVYGVPFRAGVNTDTYKHYIDFAAENGIEYIILDEGWYTLGDLMSTVPEINMDALAAYARQKGVGLIMWVIWKTLDLQLQPALDRFEKWGVKGIKVDFMQREDQWMVNYYERVAKEAAKRRMLVDFHGAYKPTGLYRTYPNVITSEGVKGLENSKWDDTASPDNAVTFPFLRMLAGPADYTPGGMLNATKADFKPVFNRPMTQGTRCHQLAMYVVFESPLQMLADSPSNYRKEPETLAFLGPVPSVWDETRVLSAKVGEQILVARRNGAVWYVGALTNWTPRDIDVDLSFLGAGSWQADIYRDGPNADRAAVDYAREKKDVSSTDTLKVHLAPGGGVAMRIVKK